MKNFNKASDAINWVQTLHKETAEETLETVAKEIYQDSKMYTYLDTEEMYKSGENSDFKAGEVTLKAPQVRWLYYTFGIRGHRNYNAVPYWFERTFETFKSKYTGIFYEVFNKGKR